MTTFRDQLRALQAHPGVRLVVAAGHDGLLIDHAVGTAGTGGSAGAAPALPDAGDAVAAAEHLAALAPGMVAAADMLADASRGGGLRSVVVEAVDGLVVALPISPEVIVLASVDPAAPEAGATIAHVRAARGALAQAV